VAILHGKLKADLAVTGGVHTSYDVLKAMMAGAQAVELVSALLKRGVGHLATLLAELKTWMEEHEYESIRQMQGSMSQKSVADPNSFLRANYLKVLSSYSLRA
jgi:dihydroorotate dehydrogenase (fumarate)